MAARTPDGVALSSLADSLADSAAPSSVELSLSYEYSERELEVDVSGQEHEEHATETKSPPGRMISGGSGHAGGSRSVFMASTPRPLSANLSRAESAPLSPSNSTEGALNSFVRSTKAPRSRSKSASFRRQLYDAMSSIVKTGGGISNEIDAIREPIRVGAENIHKAMLAAHNSHGGPLPRRENGLILRREAAHVFWAQLLVPLTGLSFMGLWAYDVFSKPPASSEKLFNCSMFWQNASVTARVTAAARPGQPIGWIYDCVLAVLFVLIYMSFVMFFRENIERNVFWRLVKDKDVCLSFAALLIHVVVSCVRVVAGTAPERQVMYALMWTSGIMFVFLTDVAICIRPWFRLLVVLMAIGLAGSKLVEISMGFSPDMCLLVDGPEFIPTSNSVDRSVFLVVLTSICGGLWSMLCDRRRMYMAFVLTREPRYLTSQEFYVADFVAAVGHTTDELGSQISKAIDRLELLRGLLRPPSPAVTPKKNLAPKSSFLRMTGSWWSNAKWSTPPQSPVEPTENRPVSGFDLEGNGAGTDLGGGACRDS